MEKRTQTVIANNTASRSTVVQSGVPQGSVLGPLLFLVLIDSLTENETSSNIGIFADDTRVAREIATELDAMELQADLDTLYEWAAHNNMEFNGTKFEAIKYGKKAELKEDYNYYNSDCTESISDVESLRDLGIILSSDGFIPE